MVSIIYTLLKEELSMNRFRSTQKWVVCQDGLQPILFEVGPIGFSFLQGFFIKLIYFNLLYSRFLLEDSSVILSKSIRFL